MQASDASGEHISALADIWFEGWHSGHAQYAPAELTNLRTRGDFQRRLQACLPDTRVVIGDNAVVAGFHILRDDEVYQFYVSAQARGQGVAALLMADAEACLKQANIATAWLA